MSTTDREGTWLSQDAYDRLKAELDELIANRPVIAAEINARREEGDLRENGGYHAAREEQGQRGDRQPTPARAAGVTAPPVAAGREHRCARCVGHDVWSSRKPVGGVSKNGRVP